MIYFEGMDDNARFNFNSASHVEFKGRESGDYAGIVFFQARVVKADYSIINSDYCAAQKNRCSGRSRVRKT